MSSSMPFTYRDLYSESYQEDIKTHLQNTFKLVRLVSDFASKFAGAHESLADELQAVVDAFKIRTDTMVKEFRGLPSGQLSLVDAWKTLLREVEVDYQRHREFAAKLKKNIYDRLLEMITYKRSQVRLMLNFRENLKTMVDKSSETLDKSHEDYRKVFVLPSNNNILKDRKFAQTVNGHNDYVLQLRSTNRLIEMFHTTSLPQVLDGLEDIQVDSSETLNGALQHFALLTVAKARDQGERYDAIFNSCKQVNPTSDIMKFVKLLSPEKKLPVISQQHGFNAVMVHQSVPEYLFKNEVVLDKNTENVIKAKRQCLQREATELEVYVATFNDTVQALMNDAQKHLADHNYGKLYEVQAQLCRQKNDFQIAKMRLGVVTAQINALNHASGEMSLEDAAAHASKKSSSNSTSIKTLWRRFAFKNRKESSEKEEEGGHNGPGEKGGHQSGAAAASADEEDPVYNLLKCASGMRQKDSTGSSPTPRPRPLVRQGTLGSQGGGVSTRSSSPIAAARPPLGPGRLRPPKLNPRMKSFSLDCPDASQGSVLDQSSRQKSSSYTDTATAAATCNSADLHVRTSKLRRRFNIRVGSLEEPSQPTREIDYNNFRVEDVGRDMYVALKDYQAQQPGDLDLVAGQRLHAMNTSDPDWWQGVIDDRKGYFPSRTVISVYPGQKVFQVLKQILLKDGHNDVRLLRDQIVVAEGREQHGTINVKWTGGHQSIPCPIRYLEEV